jgi:hypothetical protein
MSHGSLFYPDGGFPFAYETQIDPWTGKHDGILARCMARATCPKIIHTATSTEYWQLGQSLVTTDPLGKHDGMCPHSVRIYHLAGTQHAAIPTMPPGVCSGPPNPIDVRPVLRALILALERWVKQGDLPPESRHPRISDGSLVTRQEFSFPSFPSRLAVTPLPSPRQRLEYGSRFTQGIIEEVLPFLLPGEYGVLIPQIDKDGNELGGVRPSDVTVPLGTATGWTAYANTEIAQSDLCGLDGLFIPFATTAEQRAANRDPRPSRAERYRDQLDYLTRVRAATSLLHRAGFLLPEDVQRIVHRAASHPW